MLRLARLGRPVGGGLLCLGLRSRRRALGGCGRGPRTGRRSLRRRLLRRRFLARGLLGGRLLRRFLGRGFPRRWLLSSRLLRRRLLRRGCLRGPAGGRRARTRGRLRRVLLRWRRGTARPSGLRRCARALLRWLRCLRGPARGWRRAGRLRVAGRAGRRLWRRVTGLARGWRLLVPGRALGGRRAVLMLLRGRGLGRRLIARRRGRLTGGPACGRWLLGGRLGWQGPGRPSGRNARRGRGTAGCARLPAGRHGPKEPHRLTPAGRTGIGLRGPLDLVAAVGAAIGLHRTWFPSVALHPYFTSTSAFVYTRPLSRKTTQPRTSVISTPREVAV